MQEGGGGQWFCETMNEDVSKTPILLWQREEGANFRSKLHEIIHECSLIFLYSHDLNMFINFFNVVASVGLLFWPPSMVFIFTHCTLLHSWTWGYIKLVKNYFKSSLARSLKDLLMSLNLSKKTQIKHS